MEKVFWFLDNKHVSEFISDAALSIFKESKTSNKIKKGEYIFYPEKQTDSIFLIEKGKVLLGTHTDMNVEVPTTIIKTGDIFGQLPTVNTMGKDDYAIASEDTELHIMKMSELKSLLKDSNSANVLMMKMMQSRINEMEYRLESLLTKDSQTRILEFVLRSAEKNGQRMGYEWLIRNFSTHQEVASITATSRQTVTMTLNRLRNDNILHFDRKRMVIRDMERLKSLINLSQPK
jgi:CRP/FNR family transcriptional regulator, cyclic AMP receptor protein